MAGAEVSPAGVSSVAASSSAVPTDAPPALNVHLVQRTPSGNLWRGAAPRLDTLQALQRSSKQRHTEVTIIDLRLPISDDDNSERDSRLTPLDESRLSNELGLHYCTVSKKDKKLPSIIAEAVAKGDVYIHCMYGENRTGFAVARYATAGNLTTDRQGLAKRDWDNGTRYQQKLKS